MSKWREGHWRLLLTLVELRFLRTYGSDMVTEADALPVFPRAMIKE
jgi:hypothetical protein